MTASEVLSAVETAVRETLAYRNVSRSFLRYVLGSRMDQPVGWKAHCDGRANPELALQVEGATVQFDQGLAQGQAEAGAFIFAIEVTVDLSELQQGLWNVAGRHTNSRIDHLKNKTAVRAAPSPESYHTTGFGELDGISEKIDEDLLQLSLVGP